MRLFFGGLNGVQRYQTPVFVLSEPIKKKKLKINLGLWIENRYYLLDFRGYTLRALVLQKDLKTVTGRSISRCSSFFKRQSYCFTSEEETRLFPRLTQTGDTGRDGPRAPRLHNSSVLSIAL